MPRRKKNEGPVQNMLDLSTGHMPGPNPPTDPIRRADHEYGMVLFVPGAEYQQEIPEWLEPILKYAQEHGCVLINFDRDAEEREEFRLFDW